MVRIVALSLWLLALAVWDAQAGSFRQPRHAATPSWVTCDTVRMYYAQLGSVAAVKAWGRANGIVPTPSQERQALNCLRQAAK